MRIEIQVKMIDDDSGVDWEALGVPKPKKAKTVYRRRLVDTYDLEYLAEFTDKESLMKFNWFEKAIIVQGDYEELVSLILSVEDEGEDVPEEKTEQDLTL